jgi:predicted nucleic acid-binding protein
MAEYGAAIAAKQRAGIINSTEQARALGLFLNHCNTDYNLVAVSREIVERAVSLTQNHRLRGYDAIQLATGLITSETLAAAGITDFIFVSADNNLLQVAQLEGLTVENPNLHP